MQTSFYLYSPLFKTLIITLYIKQHNFNINSHSVSKPPCLLGTVRLSHAKEGKEVAWSPGNCTTRRILRTIIEEPLQLAHNLTGSIIGMVHIMLPFLILPLYATITSTWRKISIPKAY